MLVEPKIVLKPWGKEIWYVNKEYCGKLLFFNAGMKCSFHFHKVKHETFVCALGTILLRYGWDDDITKAETIILKPGDTFEVPVGLRHQMQALDGDASLYEFSTHHEDSDSVKIAINLS